MGVSRHESTGPPGHRRWAWPARLIIATAAILAAGTAPDAVAATAPPGAFVSTALPDLSNPTVMPDYTSWTSPHWSGWFDQANPNVHLRFVAADMFVPTVTCSDSSQYAYFWVGLDGSGQVKTVQQTGIAVFCMGTTAYYYSFWEMAPGSPVIAGQVSPGDDIEMSVYYNASFSDFSLSLTDLANSSADISAVQFCPSGQSCPRTSAEVIAENPGAGAPDVQLADFHQMGFYGITVTSQDGTHGTLEGNSLWSANMTTITYDGTVLAQPGPRIDGSTAFDDTWQNAG
jgi:hypothetical protein